MITVNFLQQVGLFALMLMPFSNGYSQDDPFIPVGQLPGGVYFVRARYDNDKRAVERFVKD